jgi:hypothetical protein
MGQQAIAFGSENGSMNYTVFYTVPVKQLILITGRVDPYLTQKGNS